METLALGVMESSTQGLSSQWGDTGPGRVPLTSQTALGLGGNVLCGEAEVIAAPSWACAPFPPPNEPRGAAVSCRGLSSATSLMKPPHGPEEQP